MRLVVFMVPMVRIRPSFFLHGPGRLTPASSRTGSVSLRNKEVHGSMERRVPAARARASTTPTSPRFRIRPMSSGGHEPIGRSQGPSPPKGCGERITLFQPRLASIAHRPSESNETRPLSNPARCLDGHRWLAHPGTTCLRPTTQRRASTTARSIAPCSSRDGAPAALRTTSRPRKTAITQPSGSTHTHREREPPSPHVGQVRIGSQRRD